MPKISYAAKARGERQLMRSLFDDEQREKPGQQFGVEFGVKRQRDDGAGYDRGSIRPDHAVNARQNRLKAPGFSGTDHNFGRPDSHFGFNHLNGPITRPAYASGQTSARRRRYAFALWSRP